MEISKLLKLLKKHSPHKLTSIDVSFNNYANSLCEKIEYSVYVNDSVKTFNTYREMEQYVYKITDTLSINQLTKMWADEGGNELIVE